jgi:hypothetical protein
MSQPTDYWPYLSDYSTIADNVWEEDSMTLIAAVRVGDNVLMLGDKRETSVGEENRLGLYRDDAQKVHRLDGGVIVGYGGRGQWAEAILAELGTTVRRKKEAHLVAEAIHRKDGEGLPWITWLFASTYGQPEMVYLETGRRPKAEAMRLRPVSVGTPWRSLGVGRVVADAILPHLSCWQPGGASEARRDLHLVHYLVSRYSYFVSPTFDLLDCKDPRNDQRGERLVRDTEELRGTAEALRVLGERLREGSGLAC